MRFNKKAVLMPLRIYRPLVTHNAACKCFICDELGGFLLEMAQISEVDTDMENVDSLPA